ncbi:LLM class flavin-dependent oxidoreductase [Streptomyces sp. NPDC007983]|uniref:LLM class flavin-dependent oxidoreductase n=1 Tax=Streptomyces sp. NPDC007983 TaxID=3364800 RepID=UPI0036DFAE89
MRVGVVILPEYAWPEAQSIWSEVEGIGFDHAWTYDHLAWRSLKRSPWYSSIPILTAAALATRRIKLGPLVTSPNFRHPVPLAKDVMTLDNISHGRFILGVGAGAPGLDEQIIGASLASPVDRGRRFREFVDIMDALLRNETTDHTGQHYTINEAPMIPGCVQRPRTPFAVAATGKKGIKTAARHAQIWVTNGDSKRFGELSEDEALALAVAQRATLENECREIGRDFSDIATMVNGSVVGENPADSLSSFLAFSRKCADLGFTDLTIHYPRAEGIFAGDREKFRQVMGEALPIVHEM